MVRDIRESGETERDRERKDDNENHTVVFLVKERASNVIRRLDGNLLCLSKISFLLFSQFPCTTKEKTVEPRISLYQLPF